MASNSSEDLIHSTVYHTLSPRAGTSIGLKALREKGTPCAICHQFPLDTCPLHYVSATPAELIGFTVVYELIPTRFTALRICSVPAPAVRSPPTQMRRTSISGRCLSTTQQKHTKKIIQKHTNLKKETNTSPSANSSVGNTSCYCFYDKYL